MPARRVDPRRIKLNRSYEVAELAACCGVHKNTVRHWQRAGLKPLDDKRPAQIARYSGSASLGWDSGKVALDATARFTGRQFEDDNNNRTLPAALTFDGTARVALSRNLKVEARVEHLFDKQVIAALASDGTRERALPRTIWVGLRIR